MKKIIQFSSLIVLSIFLFTNCSENKPKEKTATKTLTTPTSTSPKINPTLPDSVSLPSFEIKLELSKKADKKLADLKESIIVQAYFTGIPKDTTSDEYAKTGMQTIGAHAIELFDSRVAKFEKIQLSKKDYEGLVDKNFDVLINVYSGRRVDENNILSCDILQKEINLIKEKQHTLKGKLIEE